MIIVFREVLEAGLIIGVVLAATRGIFRRERWVVAGIALGVLGAGLVAVFAGMIAGFFQGSGQELFNAIVLFSAVSMLAWHNIWMSTHGRELAQSARELGAHVKKGDKKLIAVTTVIALAILREGSEVVLFLYGLLASGSESWHSVVLGGAFGLALGAIATAVLYFGLVAIPLKHFFSATTSLITFLAAGLAAQAIAQLQQGGYTDRWSEPLWDTRAYLSESGWFGRILHVLVGYSDQPSGMQVIAYCITFIGIFTMMKWVTRRSVILLNPSAQAK